MHTRYSAIREIWSLYNLILVLAPKIVCSHTALVWFVQSVSRSVVHPILLNSPSVWNTTLQHDICTTPNELPVTSRAELLLTWVVQMIHHDACIQIDASEPRAQSSLFHNRIKIQNTKMNAQRESITISGDLRPVKSIEHFNFDQNRCQEIQFNEAQQRRLKINLILVHRCTSTCVGYIEHYSTIRLTRCVRNLKTVTKVSSLCFAISTNLRCSHRSYRASMDKMNQNAPFHTLLIKPLR